MTGNIELMDKEHKKEYEIMSIYEREFTNNNLISNSYASNTYSVKVE